MLDFLLEGVETGLAVSTLQLHSAALSVFLDIPLGEKTLIKQFFLNPLQGFDPLWVLR